jgi:hypothetical protein
LNVHGAGGVRQIEMHTAKPLVPEPSAYEVEVAIGKFKGYKSPSVDQIQADLVQAGGETLHSKIRKFINMIQNTEKLPDQWKQSIIARIHKKGDEID